jgi:hypothetical protein
MVQPAPLDPSEFSLVAGGALFKLWRQAHLSGRRLERLWARIAAVVCITWLPLLILSLIERNDGSVNVTFLKDIEVHVRFLIALPILIAAENFVHQRIGPAVKLFIETHIVSAADLPKFHEAVASGIRLRNSVLVEAILLALVYTVGLWFWFTRVATDTGSSWHSSGSGAALAGYWYVLISIPIFQFVLIRWYMRFFNWFRFLWSVSRLDLKPIPTHPDRAGGLGFLGVSTYAFAPILFAEGTLLAGVIASRVMFEGQDILSFKTEAGALVIFFLVLVLSPLAVFTPHLVRAKREGLWIYGGFASKYARDFEGKWIDAGSRYDEELLGTGDIQSLADLGNSFNVIKEMRPVPFGLLDAGRLAAATVVPLIPLVLTVFSLQQVIGRLAKIIF